MPHSITTFDAIVRLSNEQRGLLDKAELTDGERARLIQIPVDMDALFAQKRREQALKRAGGVPQILGTYGERDRAQIRQIAHGIQPLPRGGG